jgi:hypothetical protein
MNLCCRIYLCFWKQVCLGCGAHLQTRFPEQPGFITEEKLNKFIETASIAPGGTAPPSAIPAGQAGDSPYRRKMKEITERFQAVDFPTGPVFQAVGKLNPADYGNFDPTILDGLSRADFPAEKQLKKQLARQLSAQHAVRCARCFQLTHYGFTKGNPLTLEANHFRELLTSRLSAISDRVVVVLKVVDILDLAGSFVPDFGSIAGNETPHRVILVANKVDLLWTRAAPTNPQITQWVRDFAKSRDLRYDALFTISAETGKGVRHI